MYNRGHADPYAPFPPPPTLSSPRHRFNNYEADEDEEEDEAERRPPAAYHNAYPPAPPTTPQDFWQQQQPQFTGDYAEEHRRTGHYYPSSDQLHHGSHEHLNPQQSGSFYPAPRGPDQFFYDALRPSSLEHKGPPPPPDLIHGPGSSHAAAGEQHLQHAHYPPPIPPAGGAPNPSVHHERPGAHHDYAGPYGGGTQHTSPYATHGSHRSGMEFPPPPAPPLPHSTTQHHHHLPAGQVVTIHCKANPEFHLAVRPQQGVVMVPANPYDSYQLWIQDAAMSTRVKDSTGSPAFALINKATGQALRHAHEDNEQVLLAEYEMGFRDETILWSQSEDMGDGYRCIQMVNKITSNLDALQGDKKSGGIKDGTPVILFKWKKQENQIWKLTPACASHIGPIFVVQIKSTDYALDTLLV
ncbi:unnamed protein product [Sphagnum jensenii]|uniref:Uncharacterized protein n=1 Tax=Sphagnum jensenii TaxID=128206 RepID=A0ABP0X5U5_9BRYO